MRVLDWETGDREELTGFIRSLLVAGFFTFDDVQDWVRHWVEDSGVVAPAEAAALVRSMWNERLAEQSSWSDTGDYGRLQHTFDQLQAEGIVARMCFSCCTACATHDIDDQRTPNPDTGDWYRYREWAYTFFHEQDAQDLATPNPVLHLGYSAFRPHPALPEALIRVAGKGDAAAMAEATERTDVMVGERIVELANHFGLETMWSGSGRDRIPVTTHHWRKPLP